MAAHEDQFIVKIPLPSNVDPDWQFPLSDRENHHSPGFHAGVYLDGVYNEAWSRLSLTISDRIPCGHSIQTPPDARPFQDAHRARFPKDTLHPEEVQRFTATSWGTILWYMVNAQREWWLRMKRMSPRDWGQRSNHPVWQAWRQDPSPDKLWYVALRRTVPDEYGRWCYFPDAELRFPSHLYPVH